MGNDCLRQLAKKPLRFIKRYNAFFFVNGYKFHTMGHASSKATMNSGVCIQGSNYSEVVWDYYGRIKEILELEYTGLPVKKLVLFNCEWFDNTVNVGTKVHERYKLIDVNIRRRYNKYEPFVLAMQATQVYYISYPSKRRDKTDWFAVSKVRPRSVFDLLDTSKKIDAFQEDEVEAHQIEVTNVEDETQCLNDPNGNLIDLDEEEVEEVEELLLSETDTD